MEFLKRPVAPYFVPVPGLDDLPSGESEPIAVAQPRARRGPGAGVGALPRRATAPQRSRRRRASPRCWHWNHRRSSELRPFLTDADAGVRRTAVARAHRDTCPTATRPRCSPRSATPTQRCAAQRPTASANSSRCSPIRERCSPSSGSADPVVRGAAIYVLSARRVGRRSALPARAQRRRPPRAHRGGTRAGVGRRRGRRGIGGRRRQPGGADRRGQRSWHAWVRRRGGARTCSSTATRWCGPRRWPRWARWAATTPT